MTPHASRTHLKLLKSFLIDEDEVTSWYKFPAGCKAPIYASVTGICMKANLAFSISEVCTSLNFKSSLISSSLIGEFYEEWIV